MYTRTTKCIVEVFVLCAMYTAQAATVLSGNAPSERATFDFSLGKYSKGIANKTLFVAAKKDAGGSGKVNNFAIARLQDGASSFEPLSPELLTLNIGAQDQPDPLFDAGIAELALLENTSQGLLLPAVVTQNMPNVVFLYEIAEQKSTSLLQSLPLRDSTNSVGSHLFGLITDNNARIFSMIKPVEGDFGQPGTGIVGVIRGTLNSENKMRVFSQIDLPTGNILDAPFLRAFPLDISSDVLKIGDADLSAITEVVSLHWDDLLQRLFIGLQVTAGQGQGNGARSIVVGRLENNKMILSSIAPDSAFDNSPDNIVGGINDGVNPSVQINVHSLKTMHTSTGLSYLIVQGGQGSPSQTEFTIYALPLVSGASDSLNGTIASRAAVPVDIFHPGPSGVPLFAQRNLMTPAITPQELPSAQDESVRIESEPLKAGIITDMFVQGDTIFVTVANDIEPQFSGVYYTRAIFASDGKIAGWTLWQFMQSSAELVFGALVNGSDLATIFITQDQEGVVNTVKKTNWSVGDQQNFGSAGVALNNFFAQNNVGITNLVNFGPDIPGIDIDLHPTGIGPFSVLSASGKGMTALIQTGFVDAQLILPLRGNDFDSMQTFDNGTISDDVNSALVFMQGGVLGSLGFIASTDVAVSTQSNQAWLVLGGVGGVAILSQQDGSGWDASSIGDRFSGLTAGMSFKKIGNYSFVRKIVADGDFIYILTNDRLDRINTTELNGGVGTTSAVTIATLDQLGLPSTGALLDLVISQSLGLLATSDMLFRIADGFSVVQIGSNQPSAWQRIDLPEGIAPILQLSAVTVTGRAQDLTRNIGGNVLVLGGDQGNDRGVINRLAVKSLLLNQAVETDTVAILPDIVVQNNPSNFLTFGRFVDQLVTDGAVYMTTQNATVNDRSVVRSAAFSTQPRTGKPAIGIAMQPIKILSSLGSLITSLQRNIASGAWMIAGDFGLRINE